uniref:Uncharacterized protein n=1 Tax=Lygus hesperus TaxID=30085 RepID=A0A146L6G5_LYGHE
MIEKHYKNHSFSTGYWDDKFERSQDGMCLQQSMTLLLRNLPTSDRDAEAMQDGIVRTTRNALTTALQAAERKFVCHDERRLLQALVSGSVLAHYKLTQRSLQYCDFHPSLRTFLDHVLHIALQFPSLYALHEGYLQYS